ncbi:hypothetical protein GIW54_07035 [Pseudomonas proteolytica]|uniref:Uncharacterized protein n=1 Tax=Pseudomonas proteolytica TaxID=219574 RepID=A0AAW5A5I8_9PSED|nr:hypothetical protein [Pseudomonas proteolytica]MCF5056035.1 hypothetical protein [Pseudomonas proteolytica]MCF5100517.1 hypothetical protein [Pseudomonas proteolytica]
MPAPELTTQTPGEPIASTATTLTTPLAGAIAVSPAAPAFTAKHNGGGRWIVYDANAPQVDGKDVKVGDFTGTKDEALAEADRLTAGGEPLVLDPERVSETKPQAVITTTDIDATALKQAVLTEAGWLCPEPVVKG